MPISKDFTTFSNFDIEFELSQVIRQEINTYLFLGGTIGEIAKEANIAWHTVKKISTGTTTHPHIRTLFSLLDAFGLEFQYRVVPHVPKKSSHKVVKLDARRKAAGKA